MHKAYSTAPARILAIDDSQDYLDFLKAALGEEGYHIEFARSGAEGIAKVQAGGFDCVLVGWRKPGLDGIEVCRRISELQRKADHPVSLLMLTALDAREGMRLSFE